MLKLKTIILCVFSFLNNLELSAQSNDNSSRPNIVMISVDDMKDWVGYLGGYEGKVYMHNVDQLVKKGIGFTIGHTVATICSGFRYIVKI
ncbi:hypothetical protein [Membranihabitans marinus]|uniref:hypothetical protein n=1 Tax=Membranihabitans marinus TaxID=1227546 RepID=UPI001F1AEA46|nr:hypothetical protein [Membranihabitans marinus]